MLVSLLIVTWNSTQLGREQPLHSHYIALKKVINSLIVAYELHRVFVMGGN